MNPHDFIKDAVKHGALQAGVSKHIAEDHAERALDQYKKGLYRGKVSNHIEQRIKDAKKERKQLKAGK